jgi:hypothetical protein
VYLRIKPDDDAIASCCGCAVDALGQCDGLTHTEYLAKYGAVTRKSARRAATSTTSSKDSKRKRKEVISDSDETEVIATSGPRKKSRKAERPQLSHGECY